MQTTTNGKKINLTNFSFWQNWLFYSSLLFAAFSIVSVFYRNNLVFLSYDKMIAKVLFQSTQFPVDAELYRTFIYGPLLGTLACCYILLAFIAWYPFKEKKQWARNAIIIAFSVWLVIDSSVCLYFKAYPQIYIINAFSFIVKALPILFTWKEFNSIRIVYKIRKE